jgi:hypothetical protein
MVLSTLCNLLHTNLTFLIRPLKPPLRPPLKLNRILTMNVTTTGGCDKLGRIVSALVDWIPCILSMGTIRLSGKVLVDWHPLPNRVSLIRIHSLTQTNREPMTRTLKI